MEILIPLLISSIAGLSTVIGGLVVYFKIKKIDEFISFCLSFSLSVMISISVVELIPESSYIISNKYGLLFGSLILISVFVFGCLLVNLLNKTIKKRSEYKNNNLYRVGVLSMLALMLHNFPEGIATFMSAYKNIYLGLNLGLAIMMHNIPEGISIAVPIYYSTGSKKRGVLYSLISGLAEPLGAILTFIIFRKYISDITLSIVLIFVAGLMITLAINELFPEVLRYNKKKNMIAGLILGVVLVCINHFLF